jgi:hypothetical protein
MPKKPDQLQLLDKEISRLKRRATQLEQQIDGRLDYFQDNFRSLAIKSILPGFLARAGITGTILDLLMDNRVIRKSVNKLTGFLFDKVSVAINLLTKKFGRKAREES